MLSIEEESAAILDAAEAAAAGHAGKTLVKDGPLRVTILGFKSGAALHEHHSDGPVSIHVLSGHVRITSSDRSDSLQTGRALVFDSSVSDSVVLLTMAWPAK